MSKSSRNEGKPIASPEDTLTIALSLAKQGWPVFPVKLVPVTRADGSTATDKRPLVKWLEGATTDFEQIATWWGGEFPGAWVGVHAARAGIVVVDFDLDKPWPKDHPLEGKPKGDGRANLRAAGLELPKTFRYRTRSGGSHWVYKAPPGVEPTIGRDVPVPSVDIRAGNGLMVYYGPAITEPPTLAPAPTWATLVRASSGTGAARAADGDVDTWLARASDGKPKGELKRILKRTDWRGLKHDAMLETVSELIKRGPEPGAATAFAAARERYLEGRPDRARDWDNAARGSIGRHGVPPATFALSRTEREVIAQANEPEALEEAAQRRKNEWRIRMHNLRSVVPGSRVLEDGPLALELSEAMADHWAWAKGLGLMRWTGKVWVPAEAHALVEEVRGRLDVIEVEEHEAAVHRGDNKGIDKARTLLSRNRARNVSDLIIGRLAIAEPAFDSHPHLLNVANGVVDLRTSTLMPHDPTLYLTKIAAAAYDPKADQSMWLKALTALPPKVADWLQVRLGQAATGLTPDDDVLVILEGGGENGKTAIIHAPRVALGDHSTRVPARLLDADPGDHPTTLMTLMGARYALVEELPEGRNLNVKRLKDAVGTPEITARRMRQDDVTFSSTHALFLSTNYLPIVAETDHGTWRRLALVRFPYTFVKRAKDIRSDRDRIGDRKIKRYFEGRADPGVLRWLVDGARRWYELGEEMPPLPKRVERDTDAWRLDADPVMGYVSERLKLDEGSAITTEELARDFNDHLERRGHRPWSAQTINSRFEGHVSMTGVQRRKVRFGRIRASRPPFSHKAVPPVTQAWVGVRFKEDTTYLPSEADKDAAELADLEKRLKG